MARRVRIASKEGHAQMKGKEEKRQQFRDGKGNKSARKETPSRKKTFGLNGRSNAGGEGRVRRARGT